MVGADDDTLRTTVQANDLLLQALVSLLALKDDHLLEELRGVFQFARRQAEDAGLAPPAAWAHIRKELAVIAALVGERDSDDDDCERPALLS